MHLISQDNELIALVREIALTASCPLTVVPSPEAEHCSPLMRGRILLGSDQVPGAPRGLAEAPVVTAARDAPAGEGWMVLPDARGLLGERLRQCGGQSSAGVALAVMGASGGVGASTVAQGLRAALAEVTGSTVQIVGLSVLQDRPAHCWCDDVGEMEARLAAACAAGPVTVVDLPRWQAPLLTWMESLVVVAADRVASLDAAAALAHQAREQAGLEPTFVVASTAGGLWPGDMSRSVAQQQISVWPADRRLAQADESTLIDILGRGRWRTRCLDIAHRALERQTGGAR